ncbi:uncharacterized protein LOC144282574 [Canis aureus]
MQPLPNTCPGQAGTRARYRHSKSKGCANLKSPSEDTGLPQRADSSLSVGTCGRGILHTLFARAGFCGLTDSFPKTVSLWPGPLCWAPDSGFQMYQTPSRRWPTGTSKWNPWWNSTSLSDSPLDHQHWTLGPLMHGFACCGFSYLPSTTVQKQVCTITEKKTQLILEQHRFELHGSTYTWIFFNKHSTL